MACVYRLAYVEAGGRRRRLLPPNVVGPATHKACILPPRRHRHCPRMPKLGSARLLRRVWAAPSSTVARNGCLSGKSVCFPEGAVYRGGGAALPSPVLPTPPPPGLPSHCLTPRCALPRAAGGTVHLSTHTRMRRLFSISDGALRGGLSMGTVAVVYACVEGLSSVYRGRRSPLDCVLGSAAAGSVVLGAVGRWWGQGRACVEGVRGGRAS